MHGGEECVRGQGVSNGSCERMRGFVGSLSPLAYDWHYRGVGVVTFLGSSGSYCILFPSGGGTSRH